MIKDGRLLMIKDGRLLIIKDGRLLLRYENLPSNPSSAQFGILKFSSVKLCSVSNLIVFLLLFFMPQSYVHLILFTLEINMICSGRCFESLPQLVNTITE